MRQQYLWGLFKIKKVTCAHIWFEKYLKVTCAHKWFEKYFNLKMWASLRVTRRKLWFLNFLKLAACLWLNFFPSIETSSMGCIHDSLLLPVMLLDWYLNLYLYHMAWWWRGSRSSSLWIKNIGVLIFKGKFYKFLISIKSICIMYKIIKENLTLVAHHW